MLVTDNHKSVNRWVSTRFNLLSSVVVGLTGVVALINPRIDASLAGFTLAFASTVTNDVSSNMTFNISNH